MNNQSLELSSNETLYNKRSIISEENTLLHDGNAKGSDVSREFSELNREIYKTIQNDNEVLLCSEPPINNTNNSLGTLLDNTWANDKVIQDSSENLINKFQKIKTKTLIDKNKNRRIYINNPYKSESQFKPNNKKFFSEMNIEKQEYSQFFEQKGSQEDYDKIATDDVPTTIEEINKLYINSSKTNNLNELNGGNNKINHYNNLNINNSNDKSNSESSLKLRSNDQLYDGNFGIKTSNYNSRDRISTIARLSTNETGDSFEAENNNKGGNLDENFSTVYTSHYPILNLTPTSAGMHSFFENFENETLSNKSYKENPANNIYYNNGVNNFSDNSIRSYINYMNYNSNASRLSQNRQVNRVNLNNFSDIPFTFFEPHNCKNVSEKKKFKKSKEEVDQTLFIIKIENIIYGKDKRTTIMIRHIPNKYSTQSLLEEINIAFKGKFDFFYLPMDFENHCNLGYAFINFVEPLHIIYFYETFKSRKWKKYKSHKECDLSYAKFQGKLELTSHLEKSCITNKFGEDKKPIILMTPDPLPKIEITLKYAELFKTVNPHLVNKVLFLKNI